VSGRSEFPESGKRTYRHSEPLPVEWVSGGDPELIAAVDAHVEAHIGPISWVYHEIVSQYVHVDVHCVPPGPDRPFQALVTSGMAERPMNTGGEVEGIRHAELMAVLPPEWDLSDEALKDERHYWPVRWLKSLAVFPHAYGTWLGAGHTVPTGDPAEPLADGVAFTAVLLLPSVLFPPDVHRFRTPSGKAVDVFCIVPLYPEELELKLRQGVGALLDRFDRHGVNELIRPDRVNVARRRWRLPWTTPGR